MVKERNRRLALAHPTDLQNKTREANLSRAPGVQGLYLSIFNLISEAGIEDFAQGAVLDLLIVMSDPWLKFSFL